MSVDEVGAQARDEEATATQGPPHKKRLLDEGSLQVTEEDLAPAPSVPPPGELSSGGGRGGRGGH